MQIDILGAGLSGLASAISLKENNVNNRKGWNQKYKGVL